MTGKVLGAKYNDSYNDEGKNIYAFFLLPDITRETRKEFIGIEITFIGDSRTNVLLAPVSGGLDLERLIDG